jgi:putative sporulation protein YyaC
VGTFLEKASPDHIHIYGTLDNPVHAMNLADTVTLVQETHPKSIVIAIDACLGQSKSVGLIQVGLGPIKPGAGVNKNLPEVGQVHVTGIVNVSGFMEYFVLQNTRLNIVMNMAETISSGILSATALYRSTHQTNENTHPSG